MSKLFLLFTIVPFVELYLLLNVGRRIGVFPTLGMIILTGFLGAWLAKKAGRAVIEDWRRAVQSGRIPEDPVLEGALVLVGGVLLVAPGVLTDIFGLALLFPPTRAPIKRLVRAYVYRKIQSGQVRVAQWTSPGERVVHGEASRVDEPPPVLREPDDK